MDTKQLLNQVGNLKANSLHKWFPSLYNPWILPQMQKLSHSHLHPWSTHFSDASHRNSLENFPKPTHSNYTQVSPKTLLCLQPQRFPPHFQYQKVGKLRYFQLPNVIFRSLFFQDIYMPFLLLQSSFHQAKLSFMFFASPGHFLYQDGTRLHLLPNPA